MDILLSTLNATYQHAAFGLRYLRANLGEFKERSRIIEYTINENPRDIAEDILSQNPKILALGVYIWNTRPTEQVIRLVKKIRPDIKIVLGGPEVSFETESQSIVEACDHVVQGEGEDLFRQLCQAILEGGTNFPKVVKGALPELTQLKLPYEEYTAEDIRNRILYVEASRGCPYKCEFCLSSLDEKVRSFPLDHFLQEMESLIQKGARQFKFVDRTFNLDIKTSRRILEFFLERVHLGLFLHFELIPDRLPEELQECISRFPEGALQFEIGIQTWNPEIEGRVQRRQNHERVIANFKFLTEKTGVHIHADLIAGLPGEDLKSFGRGFDAVAALKPQEIQVGILKRLKGTPISRHDATWQMVYDDHPPFSILQNRSMSFQELQQVTKFAKFWDLYANSGNFPETMKFLENLAKKRPEPSLFWEFFEFSEWLSVRHPQRHSIALVRLVESFWLYLTTAKKLEEDLVRDALIQDYTGKVKRDVPPFLRGEEQTPIATQTSGAPARSRQLRHWQTASLSTH